MKGILIGILLLCSANALFAQDTIYINQGKWVTPSEAKEYAIITPKDKILSVSFYTPDHRLKKTGDYSIFNKKKEIRHGIHTYFYPNGKDSVICPYIDNKPHGQKLAYYKNGNIYYRQIFNSGTLDTFTQYYENGKIKRTEVYGFNGVEPLVTEGHLYDTDGTEIDFIPFMEIPQINVPGGNKVMMIFLAKNIQYPKDLEKKREMGSVVINCEISPEGKVTCTYKKKAHPLFNEEAMRVVKMLIDEYGALPGKREGIPSRMSLNIPINFRLN
ncbi:MAG: TonB family protein [Bacteroides sp.]|nr:TonB family protein [Bacteroides sp.]